MASRPDGDVWNIVDNDKDSQHYGRNFKLDFSYISREEIKDVVKDYVWQNYRVGNKTLSRLYGEVNSWFKHFIKYADAKRITSLNSLDNAVIDEYVSYLHTTLSDKTNKPLSYNYQKVCLDVLKSVIRWCQLHRPNDVPTIEIFTGSEYIGINRKVKIDFIPDDVVAQINEALKKEENPYLKYGIIILQSTGMRIGDLLKLRIDCIKPHLISGYTIEWTQHKGRKDKAPMPVRSECVAAIEKLIEITAELRSEADEKDKDTLMIYRVSKGIGAGSVSVITTMTFTTNWFRDFIKRNNIKDANGDYYNLTSHQFRRTLGTDMLSKGTNINVIQNVLGHSDPFVTKRFYADVKDKERAEVFKSVGVIGNINQIQSSAFDNVSEFEWFKANKDKGACMCDGYCTKPVVDGKICDRLLKRQKCYTCSRYITTPEYLEAHKKHLATDMKETVKQYAYYKLGKVKPQTVRNYINGYLPMFVEYCSISGIHSFADVTLENYLNFNLWMKDEKKVATGTGNSACHVVEEIIRIGQIKGWNVPQFHLPKTETSNQLWNTKKSMKTNKTKPIPEDVFDKILYHAVHDEKDALTKAGIIIQSQTGLRINEVLSIQEGCVKRTSDGYDYMEVTLGKTEKGEPIIHKVFINNLVKDAIAELSEYTAELRKESGLKELFLCKNRNKGNLIDVYNSDRFGLRKYNAFIKKYDIRDNKGELYQLASHQFRATFVRELIKRKVPIAMIMKQYSHVSIEMTAHYLTLQEEEVKEIYSDMILSPESRIAGLRAKEIKGKLDDLFHGKTEDEIDDVITGLAKTMSFNPLPTGVCLYDFRRGNCTDGDGCFFYNCPNYITEVQFYPILKDELDLLEKEMARLKELGHEREWQKQYIKYKYLKPLVESLEVQLNGKESVG